MEFYIGWNDILKNQTQHTINLEKKENTDIEKITGKRYKENSTDNNLEMGLYTIENTFEQEMNEKNTKFIYGSLRSGQKLEYDGNLVIIGDVNAGAEVYATGNIAIVGMLRGLAHAGASGNKKTQISAMGINAAQVRIADIIKELPHERETKRETALLKDNEIIIKE